MSDKPDQKKKIIVDEDWKTKVQAEKEALRQKEEAEGDAVSSEPGEAGESKPAGVSGAAERSHPLPPASLTMLSTTLATQAMVAMGLIPSPLSEKSECRLDEAKHFIDTLQMLQEKTEGNRTSEESEVLEGMLHELRMGFVAIQSRQGQPSDAEK